MMFAELLRYLTVGIANTTVSLAVILFVKDVLKAETVPANASGYVVGFIVSFALNKRWTFRFRGRNLACIIRFSLTFCVSYLANLAVVLTLAGATGSDVFWWQLAGAVVYSGLFYLGCRVYVFPKAPHLGPSKRYPALANTSNHKNCPEEDVTRS